MHSGKTVLRRISLLTIFSPPVKKTDMNSENTKNWTKENNLNEEAVNNAIYQYDKSSSRIYHECICQNHLFKS